MSIGGGIPNRYGPEKSATVAAALDGTSTGNNQRRQTGITLRRRTGSSPVPIPKMPVTGIAEEALDVNLVNKVVQCVALQFSIDEVACDAGATPRAVESVRAGDNGMQFTKIVNWCRRNPLARAQFAALLGCETEVDPDFVEGLSKLRNYYVRLQAEE